MNWRDRPEAKTKKALRDRDARVEADRRLRRAKAGIGHLTLRMQTMVRMPARGSKSYQAVNTSMIYITVDEALDVWALLKDTQRFWNTWRPARCRTEGSVAGVEHAWELLARASKDLRG